MSNSTPSGRARTVARRQARAWKVVTIQGVDVQRGDSLRFDRAGRLVEVTKAAR